MKRKMMMFTTMMIGIGVVLSLTGSPTDIPTPLAITNCPVAIAHRGSSLVAPENTAPAISAALAGGAQWIENDVRFSKSDVPFIIHDADIYRTSNSTIHRNVQDMWWYEIAALDFGYPKQFGTKFTGTKVLTLYEWLVLVKNGGANGLVELKTVPDANELTQFVSRIDQTGMWDRVIIQSFYPDALAALKAVRPSVRVMLLDAPAAGVVRTNTYLDSYGGYNVAYAAVTRENVAYWQSAGHEVYAWTSDDPVVWQSLRLAGVDGILTNDAPALVAWERLNCPTTWTTTR